MTTSVTASSDTLRHKRSVKNYLIDSRFQLKYTGFIVGIAIVISAILGTFLWRTSRELIGESQILTAQSQALVSESKKVSDIAKSSIKQMGYDDATFLSDFNSEAGDYDKQMEAKEQALIAQQQSLIARQSTLLYTLVGGLALMVVLIGLLGIYFTHKVAGPIFKMRRLLRQVGEGRLVFSERLRKGDELKEFFDDFSRMVEQLRARQAREIGELDAAIVAAETAGASADAVAKVVIVRDEMKRSARFLKSAPWSSGRDDRGLDVLDERAPLVERNAEDVDAETRDRLVLRKCLAPEAVGCAQEVASLACVDARERPDERSWASSTDFDDGDKLAAPSDHVNLESSDADVRPEDLEAAGAKKLDRRNLGASSIERAPTRRARHPTTVARD